MSLNVEQITSRLAQMPDAALQKYAAMNKNDPYIMALAVSESNRRKQVRQAAQAQQSQIPQPKVVDTAVQGMAAPMPEDVGIGRLPAGNMNFADGGIVAFADGGDVERYQGGGWFDELLSRNLTPAERARRARIQEEAAAGRLSTPYEQERAANMAALAAGTAYSPEAYGVTTPAPAFQDPRLLGAAPTAAAKDSEKREDATDKTSTAQRIPSTSVAPQAGLPGIQDLASLRQRIYSEQDFKDPAAVETEALGREAVAGAERRRKAFEEYTAKQGDVYKGREERLAKREREIEGMGDKNLGLALLQAGAAMMSTPGNLGMAVGKGIDVGSKNYVAGIDKIRAAQERLADARDKMEELRLNRDDMTFKQRAAYEADIDKAKLDAKKLSIDGIRLAADVNEKRASDIFGKTVDLAKTQYEQAGANARANAQIAATLSTPERQMWNQALAKHNGDTAAAFREMQAAKAEKFNPYQSYAEYLKAFAGKDTMITPPMDFSSYVSQFAVPVAKPPEGATVRKLPGS